MPPPTLTMTYAFWSDDRIILSERRWQNDEIIWEKLQKMREFQNFEKKINKKRTTKFFKEIDIESNFRPIGISNR